MAEIGEGRRNIVGFLRIGLKNVKIPRNAWLYLLKNTTRFYLNGTCTKTKQCQHLITAVERGLNLVLNVKTYLSRLSIFV